jgi:hypothetical protein
MKKLKVNYIPFRWLKELYINRQLKKAIRTWRESMLKVERRKKQECVEYLDKISNLLLGV